MGKNPAFLFYASDFLVDTMHWKIEEVGIYIRLLCKEWVDGFLPNDTEQLQRISGCEKDMFNKCFPFIKEKFVEQDGKLFNNKLEDIRQQRLTFVESRRKNRLGKKKTLLKKDVNNTSKTSVKHLENENEGECKNRNEDAEGKRFVKPTVKEISAYCTERKNNVDAEKFFDYYESTGWQVGKKNMKNWQASVRYWEKNSFDTPKNNTKLNAPKTDTTQML